jgi:protein TonB
MSLPVTFGLGVTLFLFYLMQYLISTAELEFDAPEIGQIVNIVRVKTKINPIPPRRETQKPPEPKSPPSTERLTLATNVHTFGYTMTPVKKEPGPIVQGPGFRSDGNSLAVLKVEPVYPGRAKQRGLSGWAIVEFTVTAQGMVKNAVVVSNCAWVRPASSGQCVDSPNSIFDRSATRAVLKFKYKPRVIDGEFVESAGVRNLIVYNMAEE